MSTQTTLQTKNKTVNEKVKDEKRLLLTYRNDERKVICARLYINHGEFVREVDREWMYNYVEERWESTKRYVHDYDLCDDRKTLAGDGSNWRGTNRKWTEWFMQRSVELLNIRFQTSPDEITIAEHEKPTTLPPKIGNILENETGKLNKTA